MQPPVLNRHSKILIIRINHSNAGFFAYVNFVLNQILYCEENNLIPVVYFGSWSSDGPNAYYDSGKGDNMWDYFFEPVAGYTYSDIKAFIADHFHPLTEKNVIQLNDALLSYLHGGKPESIYCYPYGYYTDLNEDIDCWYDRQRRKAQKLIKKHIHIHKHLTLEVDAFVKQYFSHHNVLGVHIRGTDKGCSSEAFHIVRIIPPKQYFPFIDEYIETYPDCKIFLATDQTQFVDIVREKYGQRVITQSTILSDSNVNAFQKRDGNNYQKGKEVLIDSLLLSRSSKLLKCASAVGEYAHYFNPTLKSIDVNERCGRLSWRQTWYRILVSESYIFLRDLIKTLQHSEKSKIQVLRSVFTDFPVIRRFSRMLESKQFTNSTFLKILFFVKKYISFCRHKEEIPFLQVKQMVKHAKKRVGSDYYSFRKASGKKYLEIRCDGDPQAAFFAQYLYVLQQIHFAEIHDLIPVVNFNHTYNYYYDVNRNENVWENFFEPVSNITAAQLDNLDPKEITFISPEELRRLFIGEGDEPPTKYNDRTKQWWYLQRTMGARITADYVRIRPEIEHATNQFYRKHFADHTVLGIHLRGTDKSTRLDGKPHPGPSQFTRIIPPMEYFPYIDQFVSQNPKGKLFVATDQCQFLTTLMEQYGDRVIKTTATRSQTEKAVFNRSGHGYQKGVEVLMDALLLSKCDFLLKCMSNVGEVAIYFNPDMPVIDLIYPHNPNDFKDFFYK